MKEKGEEGGVEKKKTPHARQARSRPPAERTEGERRGTGIIAPSSSSSILFILLSIQVRGEGRGAEGADATWPRCLRVASPGQRRSPIGNSGGGGGGGAPQGEAGGEGNGARKATGTPRGWRWEMEAVCVCEGRGGRNNR